MFVLVKKSTEVTKFKVHEIYILAVTKHSIRLEGPSGEDFDQGGINSVLVETAWELVLFDITGVERKIACQSDRWGDYKDQEGPWSVTKALHWMESHLGPGD